MRVAHKGVQVAAAGPAASSLYGIAEVDLFKMKKKMKDLYDYAWMAEHHNMTIEECIAGCAKGGSFTRLGAKVKGFLKKT